MYLKVITPEVLWQIGGDRVFVNALVDDLSNETPAYVDGDGRYRINSAALVRYPAAVSAELLRIGNGRWTAMEVVRETVAARRYVCGLAARS